MADVQRPRHRRRRGVDGEDLVPRGVPVEAVGPVARPSAADHLASRPVEGGAFGHGRGQLELRGRVGHRSGYRTRVLRLHDTATGDGPPARAPRSRPGLDVRLRPDRLRPAPPRPRALRPGLRRPAPLPHLHAASTSTTSPTSPTSTTRSSPGRPSRGGPSPRWPAQYEARVVGGHGRPRRRCGPTDAPHATGYVDGMVALVGRAGGAGRGLRDLRRRLPRASRRSTGYGLLARQPPRLAARRRPGRGQRGEALAARLRPLEEGQAGRALLALALGARAGPAGTPSAW